MSESVARDLSDVTATDAQWHPTHRDSRGRPCVATVTPRGVDRGKLFPVFFTGSLAGGNACIACALSGRGSCEAA